MAEFNKELSDQLIYAEEQLKLWTGIVDELKDKLREAAGDDEEVTVNGKVFWTYALTAKLREKAFHAEQPEELVDQFMRYDSVRVLDVAKLKRQRPDLYRKYQSRSLRRVL
jgi:hypothetical protein